MAGLQIKVHVSPRAAILAGKTRVNAQTFDVTEDDLKALPDSLRMELALAYEAGETLGLDKDEPAVIEPSVAAIQPILEHRALRRAKTAEEQRKLAARKAEEDAVTARALAEKGNARSRALRTWVEKNGDDEQKARMVEGFLPESEILEAICDELLELPGFEPYDPLHRGHACECSCASHVRFTTGAPQYLDSRQFARLQAAREAAPKDAVVTAFEHKASCPKCACAPIARIEARVTLEWHGFELIRQYRLV